MLMMTVSSSFVAIRLEDKEPKILQRDRVDIQTIRKFLKENKCSIAPYDSWNIVKVLCDGGYAECHTFPLDKKEKMVYNQKDGRSSINSHTFHKGSAL
jgi:hypothetical protein